jgi:hypothetical protein
MEDQIWLHCFDCRGADAGDLLQVCRASKGWVGWVVGYVLLAEFYDGRSAFFAEGWDFG